MDCKAYDMLIAMPEQMPKTLLADKGYDADIIRADLAQRGVEAAIPGRSNRRVKIKLEQTTQPDRALLRPFENQLCHRNPIRSTARKLPIHGPYRSHQILAQICPPRLIHKIHKMYLLSVLKQKMKRDWKS